MYNQLVRVSNLLKKFLVMYPVIDCQGIGRSKGYDAKPHRFCAPHHMVVLGLYGFGYHNMQDLKFNIFSSAFLTPKLILVFGVTIFKKVQGH